jgi:peptidoglycan/xylan/chitin deacetylase (PgdA/CDA1 family)
MRVRCQGPVQRVGLSALLCSAIAVAGCGHSHSASAAQATVAHAKMAASPGLRSEPASVTTQLNGRLFPDHVLAMTWDDGPDKHTLELARYLGSQHVSGTFFVVDSWQRDVSDYPGVGSGAFDTGYAHLPILGDLVRLHQRIGNHTLNHVVLSSAKPNVVVAELSENQRKIDPFLVDGQRLFRAPCGAWSSGVARIADSDPFLGQLIGPISWDIDGKDWESSIQCKSVAPARDCEHFAGGLRLRPRVTAARYLEAIERTGHGIVLLHDRVADVGSKYALEVARSLLPRLIARGYVFAAPVLGFSALVERASPSAQAALVERPLSALRLVDTDGDGRSELCGQASEQIVCLHAEATSLKRAGETPSAIFGAPEPLDRQHWLYAGLTQAAPAAAAEPPASATLFGDVDGDGAVDACHFEARGVTCSRYGRHGYAAARLWLSREQLGVQPSAREALPAFADVDGDGHADLCWGGADGVRCALGQGAAFAAPTLWLAGPVSTPLLGDINGDGRGDVCLRAPRGLSCAFSTGSSFTAATSWLGASNLREDAWLSLGDINGDGRADVCSVADGHVACGLAP